MISCTEFILAYNELFSFLEEEYGKKAVIEFWEYISDKFLVNLDNLVKEKGIKGMQEYWTHTLTEEGADYRMKVTTDEFEILIRQCPSVDTLNKSGVKKYKNYCDHCDLLYRRIMEKYDYSYNIEFLDREQGVCRLTVRRREGIR